MTSTVSRLRVTEGLLTMLRGVLADPIEVTNAPPNVLDPSGKVTKAHYIIFPISGADGEASFTDQFALVGFSYDITSFGKTRQSAEWLSDACRTAIVGRTAGGDWTNPLPIVGGGYCANRRVALWGGVTSEVPGVYTVPDSFRLDVS